MSGYSSSSEDEIPLISIRGRANHSTLPSAPPAKATTILPRPSTSSVQRNEVCIILGDSPSPPPLPRLSSSSQSRSRAPQATARGLAHTTAASSITAATSSSSTTAAASSRHLGAAPSENGGSSSVLLGSKRGSEGETVQASVKRKREEALERRGAKMLECERKELEKEKVRQAKAEAREARKKEKEYDQALKSAARESSKDMSTPKQRLKHMIILLDSTLFHNGDFMATFAPAVKECEVAYRLGTLDEPGVVRWLRMLTQRDVSESAKVVSEVVEAEESDVLLTLEAQGFVGLVHYSKQALLGHPLPEGATSLEQYVQDFLSKNPGKRVSLAVEGIDAFLRGHKTRVNRQFRRAVLNSDPTSETSGRGQAAKKGQKRVPTEDMFSDVSRAEIEEALVRLQLRSGCVCHMCEDGEQLAGHVISLTKAISESHYQRENPFSFYVDNGQGPSKKELALTNNKVALIWKHQLTQFSQLSSNIAEAIVAAYPSPAHLLQAYDRCSDEDEASRLLSDVVVRRGVGVTATSRRLGPVQSKRIHSMMTSSDPELLLP